MNEHVQTLAAYFQLMNSNGASHVYRESLNAGILDALATGPKTADEVAQARQLDPLATSLTLQALGALGLVNEDGDRCELTALAASLLAGSYRELGDPYWAHLPSFLKTGQPWIKMDDSRQSEAFYQSQAAALAWMLAPAAEFAAGALGVGGAIKDLAILDVGAGSAIWSLTMARHDPGTTVTAVDWPAVLEVATATARRFGLVDRLRTLAGNYHDVELPEGSFDLAVLGNITHLESPAGNRALFAKVRRALKPRGRIAVLDIFPGQAAGDVNRTLYALGLALRSESGQVYSPRDLEGFLGESGFESAELTHLAVPPFAVGMLVANQSP
jgi:2-polyprenyl-3-methyl-5-hydroxy-6-metoxy-1,4-benzoquinol methylase